jgi:hypothetical protein
MMNKVTKSKQTAPENTEFAKLMLYLHPDEKTEIRKVAKRQRRTMSSLVAEIVRNALRVQGGGSVNANR